METLETILTVVAIIAFISFIILNIVEIIKSTKYWKTMDAQLQLFKTSMKKEHDLLKRVQSYAEWLDTYHALMRTNVKVENTEFNNGVLSGARDIEESFLNYLGEYVDESGNNEQDK